MKKLLILIFSLLFSGIVLHAESLPEINIEGSEAIKKYIAGAKNTEKQQLLKLIEAGDKFAKLDLNGDICGCEPDEECPKILNLTGYSNVYSMLTQYCHIEDTHKRTDGTTLSMDWYLIDTDTRLVAISIDEKAHKAILTYSSSLVGVFRDSSVRDNSEDAISWDTINRGKAVQKSYTFDTLNYKAISFSPNNIIITYYVNRIYAAQAFIPLVDTVHWSEEHTKRQKKLADEITADLLNYQKTRQHKNIMLMTKQWEQ